jgi:hypothetical protein
MTLVTPITTSRPRPHPTTTTTTTSDGVNNIPFFPSESKHFLNPNNAKMVTTLENDNERRTLCGCLLKDEIRIYQQLIQLALNLSPREKEDTKRHFLQGCGIPVRNDAEMTGEAKNGIVTSSSASTTSTKEDWWEEVISSRWDVKLLICGNEG